MKNPYGRSNFAAVRRGGFFYVDKTPFLPLLESPESGYAYLVLLRPRRIGKSLLLSLIEHYYDLGLEAEFDRLFEGLWIHRNPTPERNAYLVLPFDFSTVAADGDHEALRRSFFETVKASVLELILRYRERVPELRWLHDRLDGYQDAEALLATLMAIVRASGPKLYVLVDEYDTFANNLLSTGRQDVYEDIALGAGFIRTFYRTLKRGTQSDAIGRIFITGVSPILLDDLSSGFNIIRHISQHPRFNAVAGFTRSDVERALDEFLATHPHLAADSTIGDRDALLATLEAYYDGYRFSPGTAERVYNSDMVLYFLSELENRGKYPIQMLDQNDRTDYARLQRLGALTGAAGAERRALLESVLTSGHVDSGLTEQFGARSLSSQEQFLSLLYYIGMLTLGPEPPDGATFRLEIPNRVIRELQWEHLAFLLTEQEKLDLDTRDLEAALRAMAVHGDIAPFLDLFHTRVVKAMGVKDLRQFSEKSLKLMLMTFISLSRLFHPLSEKEFAQGYCDLFLGASKHAPATRFAWLLELKYLPTDSGTENVEAAFSQAEKELARYASDAELVPLLTQGRDLKAGTLVFVGAQAVHFRAWGRAAP